MGAPRRTVLVSLSLAAGGLVAVIAAAVPALASGQVCAGIVIDEPSGTVTQGATVAPGSSDLDLMNAAGDTVTQNDSGLVCVINDYPPNGLQNCLKAAHGLYYYWSYWEGDPTTNTWTYASVGPAEHTVAAGQSYVEGWRYQDPGPASPAAPKPSVTPAAAYAKACSSSNPVPTTSVGPTPTTNVPTPPARRSPARPHPAHDPSKSRPGVGGSAGGAVGTSTTVTTRNGPVPPSAAGEVPTSATSTTTAPRQPQSKTGAAKFALSDQAEHGGSGGDPVLPIVVVAVVIGGLCAAAWFKWRRRPREG
jgi:hypothetical protein